MEDDVPVCKPLERYEDVYSWEGGGDQFSISKIPLSSIQSKSGVPKTLICHDMKGGYLDDRFVQGSSSSDAYRFYHWQYIDIFVYFSHNLVTIPPPCWTNAGHRHGVKVLGTLITEWKSGFECCNLFLESVDVYERFATKLVNIAEYYRFDGWLINIENEVRSTKVNDLKDFVDYLTRKMHEAIPGSLVIWYDSVVDNGKLEWQNELNDKNRMYFEVCDGIYLNYNWTNEKLENSKTRAVQYDRPFDVYVGIDVFGRGTPGDGGYNTREALGMVRQHNLSTAIFANGWVYETQGKENFTQNENRFWREIYDLCPSNKKTALPLATSFCQGFGEKFYLHGRELSNRPWNNLSLQQFQPYMPLEVLNGTVINDNVLVEISTDTVYKGGTALSIHGQILPDIMPCTVRLFETDIRLTTGLKIKIVIKETESTVDNMVFCLYLKQGTVERTIYLTSTLSSSPTTQSHHHTLSPDVISDQNTWSSRVYTIDYNILENCKLTGVNLLFNCNQVKDVHFYLGQIQIIPIDSVRLTSELRNITSTLLQQTDTRLVYHIDWFCLQDNFIDYYNIYYNGVFHGQTCTERYILSINRSTEINTHTLTIQPVYYTGEITPLNDSTVYNIS